MNHSITTTAKTSYSQIAFKGMKHNQLRGELMAHILAIGTTRVEQIPYDFL